jgi:hypothetical protein
MTPECLNCRFFKKRDADRSDGTCKRYPPILIADVGFPGLDLVLDRAAWQQPVLWEHDYCGEHRFAGPDAASPVPVPGT